MPKISELDPNHWLYKNIAFAMWPSDGEGNKHHDAKTGKEYDSSGTVSAGNRAIDENGKHLKLTPSSTLASAHYIDISDVEALYPTTDEAELTVLIGYKKTQDQATSGNTGYGRIFCKTNAAYSSGTGDNLGLAQETDADGANLRLRINSGAGGTTNIYTTTSMGLNEYHDIAFAVAPAPNPSLWLYVDGALEAQDNQAQLKDLNFDTAIGANPGSNNRSLYGDIYYVIILDRALSAEEIAEFTSDVDSVRKQDTIDFRKVSVVAGTNISAGVDALTLTTFNPTISADINIDATKDTLALTEYAATVNTETNISASLDALTLTEYGATINAETNISASLDALTLTSYPVSLGSDTNISATSDALTLTEYAASISAATEIITNVDALTLTAYNASVSIGVNISASSDTLTLTDNAATITFDRNVTTTTDAMVMTAYSAIISSEVAAPVVQIDCASNYVIGDDAGTVSLYFNGTDYFSITGPSLSAIAAAGIEDVMYDKQIDNESNGDITYIGEATPGTATSEAKWRIKKITVVNAEGDTTIAWANGNTNFTNIWDNHLSLSY